MFYLKLEHIYIKLVGSKKIFDPSQDFANFVNMTFPKLEHRFKQHIFINSKK